MSYFSERPLKKRKNIEGESSYFVPPIDETKEIRIGGFPGSISLDKFLEEEEPKMKKLLSMEKTGKAMQSLQGIIPVYEGGKRIYVCDIIVKEEDDIEFVNDLYIGKLPMQINEQYIAENCALFEIRLLLNLRHPNILYSDSFELEGKIISCSYSPISAPLSNLLGLGYFNSHHKNIIHIVNLAKGLDYLHDMGYVHCNLNPESIFFREGETIVIGDMESIVPIGSNVNIPCQKLEYKAPELMMPESDIDSQDEFILGDKLRRKIKLINVNKHKDLLSAETWSYAIVCLEIYFDSKNISTSRKIYKNAVISQEKIINNFSTQDSFINIFTENPEKFGSSSYMDLLYSLFSNKKKYKTNDRKIITEEIPVEIMETNTSKRKLDYDNAEGFKEDPINKISFINIRGKEFLVDKKRKLKPVDLPLSKYEDIREKKMGDKKRKMEHRKKKIEKEIERETILEIWEKIRKDESESGRKSALNALMNDYENDGGRLDFVEIWKNRRKIEKTFDGLYALDEFMNEYEREYEKRKNEKKMQNSYTPWVDDLKLQKETEIEKRKKRIKKMNKKKIKNLHDAQFTDLDEICKTCKRPVSQLKNILEKLPPDSVVGDPLMKYSMALTPKEKEKLTKENAVATASSDDVHMEKSFIREKIRELKTKPSEQPKVVMYKNPNSPGHEEYYEFDDGTYIKKSEIDSKCKECGVPNVQFLDDDETRILGVNPTHEDKVDAITKELKDVHFQENTPEHMKIEKSPLRSLEQSKQKIDVSKKTFMSNLINCFLHPNPLKRCTLKDFLTFSSDHLNQTYRKYITGDIAPFSYYRLPEGAMMFRGSSESFLKVIENIKWMYEFYNKPHIINSFPPSFLLLAIDFYIQKCHFDVYTQTIADHDVFCRAVMWIMARIVGGTDYSGITINVLTHSLEQKYIHVQANFLDMLYTTIIKIIRVEQGSFLFESIDYFLDEMELRKQVLKYIVDNTEEYVKYGTPYNFYLRTFIESAY